jgi:hypothetical protein
MVAAVAVATTRHVPRAAVGSVTDAQGAEASAALEVGAVASVTADPVVAAQERKHRSAKARAAAIVAPGRVARGAAARDPVAIADHVAPADRPRRRRGIRVAAAAGDGSAPTATTSSVAKSLLPD